MKDERTKFEKFLWDHIGPPLYYCEECLRAVSVKNVDEHTTVKRVCCHSGAKIIAKRKTILTSKAGVNSTAYKIKVAIMQMKAKLTGRCC